MICIAATSLDTIDVDWMFEHSKQARRMMPGGVTVIGAFFVSSDPADAVFKSSTVCALINCCSPYLSLKGCVRVEQEPGGGTHPTSCRELCTSE